MIPKTPHRKALTAALLVGLIVLGYVTWDNLVELEVSPAVVGACEKFPIATTVRWDASRLGIKSVRLELNNLGGRRKLWRISGSRGSAETGKWARDGHTVSLVWRGVVLRQRTLTTEACEKGRRR